MDISIHAPCEGSDLQAHLSFSLRWEFQSTLPVRGATESLSDLYLRDWISIHAPCEGSDWYNGYLTIDNTYFNPRSL